MIKLDLISPLSSEDSEEKSPIVERNDVSKLEKDDIKPEKESDDDHEGCKTKQSLPDFVRNTTDNITSLHLQSDFANLKRMEQEIQAALNSLKTVNSQNLTDYIS